MNLATCQNAGLVNGTQTSVTVSMCLDCVMPSVPLTSKRMPRA